MTQLNHYMRFLAKGVLLNFQLPGMDRESCDVTCQCSVFRPLDIFRLDRVWGGFIEWRQSTASTLGVESVTSHPFKCQTDNVEMFYSANSSISLTDTWIDPKKSVLDIGKYIVKDWFESYRIKIRTFAELINLWYRFMKNILCI